MSECDQCVLYILFLQIRETRQLGLDEKEAKGRSYSLEANRDYDKEVQ